jgi:adenosylmethionine-8-amino-7-oxononanoate aminotransferase
MMAYQQEHIIPDIVTMAKGMAAGYQPVGALLCRSEIVETIRDNSGFFQHGHTFMGHATAVAASLATLQAIKSENLLENVVNRGRQIRAGLRDALGNHPNVGDIRGRGLFIGVEFVLDRETKEAFDPALKMHNEVQKAAMDNGLLCYGMGGTIDGRRGDHVLIAPPYNLDGAQQQELVEKFSIAVASSMVV